jgi:hypothetical protein
MHPPPPRIIDVWVQTSVAAAAPTARGVSIRRMYPPPAYHHSSHIKSTLMPRQHNVTGCVMLERKILCYKEKCYAQVRHALHMHVRWAGPRAATSAVNSH